MKVSAIDASAFLGLTPEELEAAIAGFSIDDVQTLFTALWENIRGKKLHGGQPRNESSRSSLEFARLGLKIVEHVQTKELLAEAHSMMAYASNANESFEESLGYYESSIRAFEESGQTLKAARNRIGLMMALSMLGRSNEAIEVGRRAEATFIERNDLAGQARVSVNLGIVCHRLNEYERALEHHQKAATAFEALADEQALAQCYLNMANALSLLDKFDDSQAMFDKTQQISQRLGLDQLWRQAVYNKAYLFFLRGQFRQALALFGEIRAKFAENGSERYAALCDLDCAEVYLQMNLPAEAGLFARRAVEVVRTLGVGLEHAKATAFYGVTLTQNRQFADALDVFRTAQQLFSEHGNTYWTAVLELYRAELLLTVGRYWEARALAVSSDQKFAEMKLVHKRAASLVVRGELALKLGHLQEAQALAGQIADLSDTGHALIQRFPCSLFRAKVAERTGDHEQSRLLYLQASAEIETQRASSLHNDLRLTFFNGKQEVYRALVTLSLLGGYDEDSAFMWCERAKARQLIDMVEHHLPIIRAHTDHTLLTRINHLRHELNSRYLQLRSETSELPVLSGADAIDSKEVELNRCLKEMADIDPEYVALQSASVVDVHDLQAVLPPKSTVVEYFVAGDEVLAFVVTSKSFHVHRHLCPISRVDFLTERLHGTWRNRLNRRNGDSNNDETLRATADQFLHELYITLIAPLEEDLRGDRLLIVPHGVMHYLPFHAFYDGESYLTDRFDILYAPSGSVLQTCLANEKQPLGIPGVMEPNSFVQHSRLLTAGERTREDILGSIPSSDLIHISADCLLRPDSPLFSGLRMKDGWVTALDLFSVQCHTELVALSGTVSDVNRDGRGEDIVALQRAWLYAGGRTLFMRLWNTDDLHTEALISAFHIHWDGGSGSKANALRQAMRDVRTLHPNPYHWAPFILCGQE
jgi:tetratricopeptide (TPR) repeat protein